MKLHIEINDFLLLDQLKELAIEYSITEDKLICIAIKKLLYDVEFVRAIRSENSRKQLIHHLNEKK